VRYPVAVAWDLGGCGVSGLGRATGRGAWIIDPADEQLERFMAANCDICGKGPEFGHSISHSHRRTKRRWNPNIQRVRTVIGGTHRRLNVCTSCLKAGKVARA